MVCDVAAYILRFWSRAFVCFHMQCSFRRVPMSKECSQCYRWDSLTFGLAYFCIVPRARGLIWNNINTRRFKDTFHCSPKGHIQPNGQLIERINMGKSLGFSQASKCEKAKATGRFGVISLATPFGMCSICWTDLLAHSSGDPDFYIRYHIILLLRKDWVFIMALLYCSHI